MAADRCAPPSPGLGPFPLAIALGLSAWTTVWPGWLSHQDGTANHGAALFVAWAICAGFVRGLGFIPRQPITRYLLSGGACTLAFGLVLARLGLPPLLQWIP